METLREFERDLGEMREYYSQGKTKEASWRKSQLKGLLTLLKEKEGDILNALMQDLGKHQVETFRDEIGTSIKTLNLALESLREWMSGRKAKLPQIALLTRLSLEPMIGALAAGNTVVLKPSELAPASASLLATAISTYLDNKAVKVIQAVKHLTPVTLELGGKCPAVLDSLSSSWDIKVAVKRIVYGKYGCCAGQACIAIDYILVEKKFTRTVVELMKSMIKEMFGENPKESHSIARIINKQHLLRLKNLLKDPHVDASTVYGGSVDEDNLFIEPTILVDPPLQAEIMTDEIFGPLLPIITLEKIEDSIQFINSKPKALAIYCFTKNKTLQRRMISETSSGSVTFNDTIIQYAADTLPFGGVGGSGFGRYHGKFSFDTFSHEKAIARRSFLTEFWFRFPPWNNHKFQLLASSFNFDYLGLVLVILA
ncbi:aldehyde dehydrogenase family 3 member f1 [Quercus suber]|uniref:Aldehyde dehydrogenase n=1 Tax=Quercus suber TaxID=58331 RepID=A0AAW0K100_QUESU